MAEFIVQTQQLDLDSPGNFSVVNITDQVRDFVRVSGIKQGQVLAFYRHTTGAIIVDEHEPGIIADLQAMFERISPVGQDYLHHIRGVDFNGHAHVRSALMSVSVTVPVLDGEMVLGTYQEILVIDDQTDPAPRQVFLQASGVR